jgi:hypothetical protein
MKSDVHRRVMDLDRESKFDYWFHLVFFSFVPVAWWLVGADKARFVASGYQQVSTIVHITQV